MEASCGAEGALEGASAQQPVSGEAQWFGGTAMHPATVTQLWQEYQASQVQSIHCGGRIPSPAWTCPTKSQPEKILMCCSSPCAFD